MDNTIKPKEPGRVLQLKAVLKDKLFAKTTDFY